MIKVCSEVKVYEVDGRDVPLGGAEKVPPLVVESHWTSGDRIVISIGDKKVTVLARDISDAIMNACCRGAI